MAEDDDLPQLIRRYQQWRKLQENPPGRADWEQQMAANLAKASAEATARNAAAAVSAAEVERRAHRKGIKRMAQAVDGGASPQGALLVGHRRYRKHGGSSSLAVWRRKVAAG